MLFATQRPFVPLAVSEDDRALASIAFGWTLGFGYFTVCHAVRETSRSRRINTYVILIWTEIIACLVFAIICWLYLYKKLPPSFEFFMSILTCWALQVQLLLQIIVNRLCILLPNERQRNYLRFGVAGVILAINISVYNIWIPAKLQINDMYHDTNLWWDRVEKILYLFVDGLLNYFFIRTVKKRLVDHGFKKYDKLVRFNTQIVVVSLAMDVMIVAMMSLHNDFVYMQFHPVAYMVKLNIEMSMGNLMIKVATSTGVQVYEDHTSKTNSDSQGGTATAARAQTRTLEVHVDRQVFTQHDTTGDVDIEMDSAVWPAVKRADADAESFPSDRKTVLTGLAPNGGLYIPETIPTLPENWRSEWKAYSFVELSVAVLSLYVSPEEISKSELRSLVDKSYSTFRHPDVTPLHRLDEKRVVLELFHGPTFAFKDVALQLLGNLFEFFLLRRNAKKAKGEAQEKLTVVGATSGDTGSAAIYGLRNKANISIFILHPKGRVSPIQEAQMTTVTDANVHNVAVKGTFDDCQDIVKALFSDREFNSTHRLGAVNSINWARILAQTVYYFLSFFHVQKQLPEGSEDVEIQYVVPTGNFGDILAGYYAKKMGLPMGKLVVATNANDILARFWRSGNYEKVNSEPEAGVGGSDGRQATSDASGVKETLSPAMDILVSSNFERLLWYLAYQSTGSKSREEACKTLAEWMGSLKADGKVTVPVAALEAARVDFLAERISDSQTLETIKSHFDASTPYVVDPHTAVGLAAAEIVAKATSPALQVILATAHPAKFSEAVSTALQSSLNFDFARDVLPEEFKGLLERERRVIDVAAPDINLVKKVIEKIADEDRSAAISNVGV